MIKPVLAATLFCLSAGCYSPDATQVLEPNPIEVTRVEKEDLPSFLLEDPFSGTELTGDPAADQPLVCALRFTENNAMASLGLPPTSPIVEKYALTYGLEEADYALLLLNCNAFDMGVLFWSLSTAPASPLTDDPLPWNTTD